MGSRRERISNEAARRKEAKIYNDMLKKNIRDLRDETRAFLRILHTQHQEMATALHNWMDANERERLQTAREDARQRDDYVQGLAAFNQNRVLEFQDFMNDLRKYLLDLLDLDFGVKRVYVK